MFNKPKIPVPPPPPPPPNPAYSPTQANASDTMFSRINSPIGIFTSSAGLLKPASGQRRSLIGG